MPTTPRCGASGARSATRSTSRPTRTRRPTDASVVALLTEWDEFRWLDFERVRSSMKPPYAMVDARNLLDPAAMRRRGFTYQGVGR